MQNFNQHPLELFNYCPKCGGAFVVNNAKSKRCAACSFVYYFNPSAAVACFIRNREDEVLVAVRGCEPSKGMLDLPGGFVDVGESAEDAARREIAEETGLKVEQMCYLFSLPNRYPYSNFEVHTLDACLECRVESFDGAKAADDVSELRVVKIADLEPQLFAFESISQAVATYKVTNTQFNVVE